MKIAIDALCFLASFSTTATAFTVTTTTTTTTPCASRPVARWSARVPPLAMSDTPSADDQEGGLDLDLGEMFEMFEAADKEEDFDKTIKKVKKGE